MAYLSGNAGVDSGVEYDKLVDELWEYYRNAPVKAPVVMKHMEGGGNQHGEGKDQEDCLRGQEETRGPKPSALESGGMPVGSRREKNEGGSSRTNLIDIQTQQRRGAIVKAKFHVEDKVRRMGALMAGSDTEQIPLSARGASKRHGGRRGAWLTSAPLPVTQMVITKDNCRMPLEKWCVRVTSNKKIMSFAAAAVRPHVGLRGNQ